MYFLIPKKNWLAWEWIQTFTSLLWKWNRIKTYYIMKHLLIYVNAKIGACTACFATKLIVLNMKLQFMTKKRLVCFNESVNFIFFQPQKFHHHDLQKRYPPPHRHPLSISGAIIYKPTEHSHVDSHFCSEYGIVWSLLYSFRPTILAHLGEICIAAPRTHLRYEISSDVPSVLARKKHLLPWCDGWWPTYIYWYRKISKGLD